MPVRTRAAPAALLALLFHAGLAAGSETERRIATTPDADYVGFDLRIEKDINLDQCETVCLADPACRAFTFNTQAQWCFLKSDYQRLGFFKGAVAGRVVEASVEDDLGAPPVLSFLPAGLGDEAARLRAVIGQIAPQDISTGMNASVTAAGQALRAGDPDRALQHYQAALALAPEEGALWLGLARASLAVAAAGNDRRANNRLALSSAFNAYRLSRQADPRAEALAELAAAFEAMDMHRPALDAYAASLDLADRPAVRSAFAALRARKGFRVIEHTVDADTHTPRACIQFSEKLQRSGVDYSSYVTLDGAAAPDIAAAGNEICVEGLRHGSSYRIALRAGLPAAIAETLRAPVTLDVYVRDRAPSARFATNGFVLPAAARQGIGVASVNTGSVSLQMFRIADRALSQVLANGEFLQQLQSYDVTRIVDDIGAPVWEGVLDVESVPNKDVITSFPVDEALPQRQPGVYVLTALAEGQKHRDWDTIATQWFVVSDIGLSTFAGHDGLSVFARSLSTAEPMKGVELQLLARNNEILGTATTGETGRAAFPPGLIRGAAGLSPLAVLARNGDSDFVFLDLTRAGFDLSDRGVAGRPAPGALDVYAWTERGIYRAGERVHVTALARDQHVRSVASLPLTFVFRRPDGSVDRTMVDAAPRLGGHTVALGLPDKAMRGTWRVSVHADPAAAPLATQAFLVEDFVPDRLSLDLSSATAMLAPGTAASIDVNGHYLYGAPAAGLALEGEIRLSTRRERAGFENYVFGLSDDENGEETRLVLDALPDLDATGKARFDVQLDELPATTQLVNAQVFVRLREAGGRAVERALDLAVEPLGPMIGIRPEFDDGKLGQNTQARFTIIALDPSGARLDMADLTWSLVKLERSYQWYRHDNSWNYEPVEFTRLVADGTISASADRAISLSMPVEWGRYRLEIEGRGPEAPVTSIAFDAGWYVEPSSTETPDGLEIALDAPSYQAGSTASLRVSPRFAGQLLVVVGNEKILATHSAAIPEQGGTIEIPVGTDWGAGAYVTATLFRPGTAQPSRMPMRAIGVKWLSVDPEERVLDVSIAVPARLEQGHRLDIPIEISGLGAGETAYATIAAVDVGILNVTRYEPPDPVAWYFGQRALGLELRDLHGRLIDGSAGVSGRIRSGGDGDAMVAQASPPTGQLVAFHSGPVALDAQGKAIVGFDLPQFNGTIRVMAVAWTASGVGRASSQVVVRDPVIVTASLPKFLAPGDRSQIQLDIANLEGPSGQYRLELTANDTIGLPGVNADQVIQLAAGQRQSLVFPLHAERIGAGRISVRLVHPDGTLATQTLALPVRPAAPILTTSLPLTLAPEGGSLRVDEALLAGSVLADASVSVNVSQLPDFDVPGLLMGLERYPYGCAEQTTSRALPLLYLEALTPQARSAGGPDLRAHIQDAIHEVLAFQSASGSFGLWSPGHGDLWLDAYITDFLTRAREQRYDIPDQAMRLALDNLENAFAYDVDIAANGRQLAYALYVLARNRRAPAGDLRYFLDAQIDSLDTPLARAQIAASLALYGDEARAEHGFAAALRLAREGSTSKNRLDYGSPLRDGAAMLALAGESHLRPALIGELVELVTAERRADPRLNTQEQAWMLLAARGLAQAEDSTLLEIDGVPHRGRFSRRLTGQDLLSGPLLLTNRGNAPVRATITTMAAPIDPPPAGGEGFSITRSYFRLDGTEVNVTEAARNERFVVVLRITQTEARPSHVVVTDLLPAGFEIDNPRLVTSADLASFSWLGQVEAAHSEFLADRFTAAFERSGEAQGEFTVAYTVRAVTPGAYTHPAASVEDMYRPHLSARGATGMVEVRAERR